MSTFILNLHLFRADVYLAIASFVDGAAHILHRHCMSQIDVSLDVVRNHLKEQKA